MTVRYFLVRNLSFLGSVYCTWAIWFIAHQHYTGIDFPVQHLHFIPGKGWH